MSLKFYTKTWYNCFQVKMVKKFLSYKGILSVENKYRSLKLVCLWYVKCYSVNQPKAECTDQVCTVLVASQGCPSYESADTTPHIGKSAPLTHWKEQSISHTWFHTKHKSKSLPSGINLISTYHFTIF